jgi:hypothetical protein|tara:strand:- start:41 stop:574 length:534 start_codon:yes stop_codon:yes gene_type:complete
MEVVRIVQRVDIDRIREEYEKIKDIVPWENGQTSINYRDIEDEDKHLGGCGWHKEYFTRGHVFQKDYILYNEEYHNTLIKGVLTQYQCYRSRFLTRKSGTCYQWHNDNDYRLHIPIYSDPGNYFAFEKGIERLEPGYVYMVNTTKKHSFFNGSKTDRIHIVGNIEYGFRGSEIQTNW